MSVFLYRRGLVVRCRRRASLLLVLVSFRSAVERAAARVSQDDVFTLLSDDILHSAILPLLPAKTLVLLSMTCGRARAVVDSAPIELCLW